MVGATGRLEIRLHPDEKERLERAAQVRGISASQFARDAIRAGVDAALSGHDSLTRLDRVEFDRWRARLAAPAYPPEGLRRLAERDAALPPDERRQHRAELLDPDRHRVEVFNSGTWTGASVIDQVPGPVDLWLMDHERAVIRAKEENAPRPGHEPCYVRSANQWHAIEGFYTVRPHRLIWGDPPFEDGAEIPALMIGRLTIAVHFQREGRAGLLLLDALGRLLAASEVDGAAVIVASAPTDLGRTFYAKYGFVPIAGGDHVALAVHDARAALA